jgi:transposase
LPLYRQEAIYARDQVELDRSLMAQWMGKVGFNVDGRAELKLGANRNSPAACLIAKLMQKP